MRLAVHYPEPVGVVRDSCKKGPEVTSDKQPVQPVALAWCAGSHCTPGRSASMRVSARSVSGILQASRLRDRLHGEAWRAAVHCTSSAARRLAWSAPECGLSWLPRPLRRSRPRRALIILRPVQGSATGRRLEISQRTLTGAPGCLAFDLRAPCEWAGHSLRRSIDQGKGRWDHMIAARQRACRPSSSHDDRFGMLRSAARRRRGGRPKSNSSHGVEFALRVTAPAADKRQSDSQVQNLWPRS